MIISLNEENRKFEVFPEEEEKILNFKQEGDISKFRLRNSNSTQEIHLSNRTGVILSIDERKKALPPEKIINLKDR